MLVEAGGYSHYISSTAHRNTALYQLYIMKFVIAKWKVDFMILIYVPQVGS